MNPGPARTQGRNGVPKGGQPGAWRAFVVRARCCLGVIAAAIVLSLGPLAGAQEPTPQRIDAPTAPGAAPDQAVNPAAAPDAAPDQKAKPAPTPDDAQGQAGTPVPTPDQAVKPAPTPDAAPDQTARPVPDPPPEQAAKPAPPSEQAAKPDPAPATAPDPTAKPTPAPDKAPDQAATPGPELDQAAKPARALDTAPDQTAKPTPAQDKEPDQAVTPAPAPDQAAKPEPAPATAPSQTAKAAPAQPPPRAKKKDEPDRIRGRITKVEGSTIFVETVDGKTLRLGFSDTHTTFFSLSKANYHDVVFGTYVGAVSEKLGNDIYSPIRRDSLSWLHRGYELRIIDEDLRGIAVGHTEWDLTSTSVMTHGWVDDQEDRVISIKYGSTDYEETDVEVPRNVPVLRMSRGDKRLIKQGAAVFVGAQKGADGSYQMQFIFIGKDGIVPPM